MPKNPLTELITWLYVPLSRLQSRAPIPLRRLSMRKWLSTLLCDRRVHTSL